MKKTIYFDGSCNLCHGGIRFINNYSKPNQFHFSTLQDHPEVRKLIPKNSFLKTIILLDNNQVYIRSEAIIQILKKMNPPYFFFGYLLSFFPVFLLDFFYNIVSKSRYKIFGKKTECGLPPNINN